MNDTRSAEFPLIIDGQEYISMERAARQSRYTLRTINRLARSGKIDARPVGSTWVIAVDALAQYCAQKPQRKPRAEAGRRRARREGKGNAD